MADHSGTRRHQALNLMRPNTLPRNSRGVIAPKTNWKYASVSVGKWNGTSVLAAETACPSSPTLFIICPGLPTKFSKKCFTQPTPVNWVGIPLGTPPPIEVEPNPSLKVQSTQPTRTSEKPANIMANTLTAHFFGTID